MIKLIGGFSGTMILNFMLCSVKPSKKAGLITGTALLLIFLFSAVYLTLFFELPLPAVIAGLGALSGVYYKFKMYMHLLTEPLIFHIISLLAGIYMGVRFYTFADGSLFEMLLLSASGGAVIFFILETLLSNLLVFISDGKHPENFTKALAAVFPPLFIVLVYVPSETYFTNRKDLLFVFFDFAPYIFIKAAVFTFLGTMAFCALSSKAFRIISAAAVGLTLCVYCQYVFMNGNIPSEFGKPMDQAALPRDKIINSVIWMILFVLPIIYAVVSGRIKALADKPVIQNGHIIAGAFLGSIQIVSLVIIALTTQGSLFTHERYVLDSTEQFVVSGNKNIITFVIDEADKHYFDDVYAASPEEFDFLKDFTYYNNACMMYDATYLSIPQMLSGAVELPEYDLNTWVNEIWTSERCEEFYSRLHNENYRVNFFGDFSYNYNPYSGKADNCVFQSEDEIRVDHDKVYDSINALAAYRYMPLVFKESVINDVYDLDKTIVYKNSCIMKNRNYIDSLQLRKTDSDKNYFILEHLLGAHWQAGEEMPKRIYTCLELLRKYISQLKELGVYDDAVIIITADHGKHYSPDNVPIWYIKRAGEQHDSMQTCGAPIHHSDYLATVIDTAGLKKDSDGDLFGRSIYDIAEDEQRERLVFQRFGFEYTGEIEFKRCLDARHRGAAYGYYFTGTCEDLKKRESEGPPDILIELNDDY